MEIWQIISPFLAAGLASYFIMHYGLKKMRGSYFFEQRVASIKSIHGVLSDVNRYCTGRIGEIEGNENSPCCHVGSDGKSSLVLMHDLSNAMYKNRVFLERNEINALDELILQMSLSASMERVTLDITEYNESTIKAHQDILDICCKCVDLLYKDIRNEFAKT